MTSSLSPQLFAIWRLFIEEKLGLSYGPGDQEVLTEKLWARAQEAGFPTLLDYYYAVRYDDPHGRELDGLADALTVAESYFFRELEQLEVLVSELLEPLVRSVGRPRVWSAACAGGEEPLSLAILLDRRGLLDRVNIVASDISPRALARARAGVYSRRALRGAPPRELLEGYLEVSERQVTVAPRLVDRIDWRRVNLVDPDQIARLSSFDVVLCRNVLIYFSDETVARVVGNLARVLSPGGTLFVGVSESLLRFSTTLACEEHKGIFTYRRTG